MLAVPQAVVVIVGCGVVGWLCGVVWVDGTKYGVNTVATLKTLGTKSSDNLASSVVM